METNKISLNALKKVLNTKELKNVLGGSGDGWGCIYYDNVNIGGCIYYCCYHSDGKWYKLHLIECNAK